MKNYTAVSATSGVDADGTADDSTLTPWPSAVTPLEEVQTIKHIHTSQCSTGHVERKVRISVYLSLKSASMWLNHLVTLIYLDEGAAENEE